MVCTGGMCIPQCSPGFNLVGVACISGNLTCGKGQQPHSSGTRCATCPKNTYKDSTGNLPCTRCPNGTFTAGQRVQSHDSIDKCLAGGLASSGGNVKPPRLPQFKRHLAAARAYMRGTQQPAQSIPCSQGCSAAAISALTQPVAYIAASPQVVAPQDRLLRMPAERPTVQNQGRCASCVNAAIASAVEAAVAAAAGTNGTGAAFSPMYAYYCEPPMLRSCGSGWAFEAALNNLASDTAKFLPNANCTQSVDLEAIRNVAPSQLPAACDTVFNKCSSNKPLAECSYKALSEFWEIQQAIRVNGAVVTRVSVGSNFVEYFQSNPKGVYNISTSDDSIPHAVILIGYNNIEGYWWAQNSYGTTFADQGVFKIAYGIALAGNPNETYAINCSLAAAYPTNKAKRWPLQVAESQLRDASCYNYVARPGDFLAGIADHFGVDLLSLVAQNADVLGTTAAFKPDLATPLSRKRLTLCGVTSRLYSTSILECGVGEYQSQSTGGCEVCPHDTYKTSKGPGPCQPCATGTVTTGCSSADHDNPGDCTPALQQQLCEQFIGRFNKSGVYNITLRCQVYQVYCNMETDGGGWTLFMSYNVEAGTFPRETYFRSLSDGFPLLSDNPLGTDESTSTGPGGTWGHMTPAALRQIPNFSEFLGVFETLNPANPSDVLKAHYKSSDERTLNFFRSEYLVDWIPTEGLNLNNMRHSHTPMPDQSGFIPLDGEGKIIPTDLWSLAQAGLPVRHAVYLRGTNPKPPVCEAGWYQKGWSCHICADHFYKDAEGSGPCTRCPRGKVSGAAIFDKRAPENHDDKNDCKVGQPDASWNITQADGSLWVWEFFWSIRAQPKHAEEICQLRGGHLVTVTSASISAQLAGKVTGDDTGRPSFPVLHKLDILWTGLHSPTATSSATGPWAWYSGEAYKYGTTYTNWGGGQPDNYGYVQGRSMAFLLDNQNQWDDYYQFMYQEFVCERRLSP
ncbi:hypothetical protein OEZ86_014174 [Tetradesmus obliquus]|nr:hypothetical protein OEZ86_014174 [Tetradesmus obliquus]